MAEGNPITRLVKLVLDRTAAKQTEEDAKKSLGVVEQGLDKIKSVAASVGAALAAAFGFAKLVQFGEAAVAAAAASEKAWGELAGVVNAVGGNFDSISASLHAQASAFQDATVYSQRQYAESLGRLVTLTGDVSASTNNMGLVANVAARFYNGELEPAVTLVGKVMNGILVPLQRMGIHAKDTNDALRILAERGGAAAEERVHTFAGQLERLNVRWMDFKTAVGQAIVGNAQVGTEMGTVSGVLKQATEDVKANREEWQSLAAGTLQTVITVADALYRALRGIAEFLAGAFLETVGATVIGAAGLASGFLKVLEVAMQIVTLGHDPLKGWIDGMREGLKSTEDWGRALGQLGAETARHGIGEFTGGNQPAFHRQPTAPAALPGGTPEAQAQRDKAANDAAEAALQASIARENQRLAREAAAQEQRRRWIKELTDMAVAELDRELAAEAAAAAERQKLHDQEREAQAQTAQAIVEAAGAAVAGGMGPYAHMKSQQNLLQAEEEGVEAALALAGVLTAGDAAALATAAATHVAIAAAWEVLSGISGGSGGSRGGSAGAASPLMTQGASSNRATASNPLKQDVNVFLEGEGFDALNPVVQKVVWGATQQARERYGSNINIRLLPTGRGKAGGG